MEILHKTRKLGDRLGAGLITGAADDDPSGIATYSQGARNLAVACCGRWF